MEPLTYQNAGVDLGKADQILLNFLDFLKTRPQNPHVLSGIGGFASCFDLKTALGQMENPVLVTCCDGVGTKVKLALEWNNLSGLGHDLVAMNVNDLICCGAVPLVFLDYYACSSLQAEPMLEILKSIQEACELSGCTLAGGETAEMPGIYSKNDFDLAGFAVGLVDRNQTLGSHRIREGDALLGLSSSGPHSNGFSLLRKIIEKEQLKPNDRAPFENQSWKELFLAPTRIYVPVLREILPDLHALAHLTGGGLFENLPRVLPDGTFAEIWSSSWNIPPLFKWIQEKSHLPLQELLTTFNCGIGMIALCDQKGRLGIQKKIRNSGVPCWEIGQVRKNSLKETAYVEWR